jgi:hypothetical protein
MGRLSYLLLTFALIPSGRNLRPGNKTQPDKSPRVEQSPEVLPSGYETPVSSSLFFTLQLRLGDEMGNIFSRTISYKGDSFPELALRVSGTGVYKVTNNDVENPVFEGWFHYDGRPASHYHHIKVTDRGSYVGYDTTPSLNTDASGLMYNSFIWGTPPATLKKGDTWSVDIRGPWELGGPGKQTITVMDIDEKNNTIRLKREGSGEGYFDNDYKQVTITRNGGPLKMALTPGAAHWVGFTSFKNGLVVSDELLVSRPVTLTAGDLKYMAFQREYILLNDMPVPI